MNGDSSKLIVIVGISTAINTAYAINKKADAVPTLVAGMISLCCLSAFASLTGRFDVSNAIAVLFLISAVLMHGAPLGHSLGLLASTGGGTAKAGPLTQNQGQGVGPSGAYSLPSSGPTPNN
jgi:hypothetical protein